MDGALKTRLRRIGDRIGQPLSDEAIARYDGITSDEVRCIEDLVDRDLGPDPERPSTAVADDGEADLDR